MVAGLPKMAEGDKTPRPFIGVFIPTFCWDFLFYNAIILAMVMKFPENFLWGAATSAYQVEGDNCRSDWWEWEKIAGLKEASGQACRHYYLYQQDFDLAKSLNHNAHRFSIEWSRIEPEENKFSQSELDHYRDVILNLKQRNIEPIVTLHHFTNPIWLARQGGWQNKASPRYFLRYVDKVVRALSNNVRYWVTINEPMVYVYHAYILGVWPPEEKSWLLARGVSENLIASHINAYRLIHHIYQRERLAFPYVSIAKNLQAFVPCGESLKNKFAACLRQRWFIFAFLERLLRQGALDFIGINYYSRSLVELEKFGLRSLLLDVCKSNHQPLRKNSLGWDIYPEGLYQLLVKLKRYNLPIMVLENGICTEDDNLRWEFIRAHLEKMHLAISQGVRILGYIYWSLLDNYEWDKGFSPRFGLIAVDYHTYSRTVRESARKLAQVYQTGILEG